jgi:hypothetical protein
MPANNSRVFIGGLILVGALAYFMTGSDSPKSTPPPPKSATKKEAADPDYLDADYTASFAGSKGALKNLFLPVVKTNTGQASGPVLAVDRDQSKFPATVADGDGNWAFTGYVQVDGVPEAVLENTATHQGGVVKQGDLWKQAHIHRITQNGVAFAGKDGFEQYVLRFNPNKVAKDKAGAAQPGGPTPVVGGPPPGPGNGPMSPMMRGPIGGNIIVQPMPGGAFPVGG